jgi:hypothetical protein
VHATPHFFVRLGTSFYWELSETVRYPNGTSTTNRETSIGAGLVVGGNL